MPLSGALALSRRPDGQVTGTRESLCAEDPPAPPHAHPPTPSGPQKTAQSWGDQCGGTVRRRG